jgi:hypothetical protein
MKKVNVVLGKVTTAMEIDTTTTAGMVLAKLKVLVPHALFKGNPAKADNDPVTATKGDPTSQKSYGSAFQDTDVLFDKVSDGDMLYAFVK